MNGYTGNMLLVNLSEGTHRDEALTGDMAGSFTEATASGRGQDHCADPAKLKELNAACASEYRIASR